jgi:DNA-binding transcriptional LysR family regulator
LSSLERYRQIAHLWNWLPAFRIVAEFQSVHKAAAELAISPSALSRTVKLLEEALGGDLFTRHQTGLSLTPLGTELLSVTRDSMRRVHDCLATKDSLLEQRRGTLTIGVTSAALAVCVGESAIAFATNQDAHLLVRVREVAPETAQDDLLRGNLDFVVTEHVVSSSDLNCERLGSILFGVYAPLGHARLRESAPKDRAALQDEPFVLVEGNDAWGADAKGKRIARLLVASVPLAVKAAVDLQCLTVLPRGPDLSHHYGGLERLLDLPDPVAVMGVRRKRLADQATPVLDDFSITLHKALSDSH